MSGANKKYKCANIDKPLDYGKINIADRVCYDYQINKQYGEFSKEEPALWHTLSALVGSPFLFGRLDNGKDKKRKRRPSKVVQGMAKEKSR